MKAHPPHITIAADDSSRLTLAGELTYEDAPTLRRMAGELLEGGAAPLRVDARELDFLDSSGLSALVFAAKKARDRGTHVRIIGAHTHLQHLLHVTRMSTLFELEDPSALAQNEGGSQCQTAPVEVSFDLPCHPTALGVARDRVNALLDGTGFTASERADIQLALGEAIANAIRHGCPLAKNGGGIHVRAACGPEEGLTLEITDPGPGFDAASLAAPDVTLLKEGGMGVFFMRSVMDTVEYHQNHRGNTVTMTKRHDPSLTFTH